MLEEIQNILGTIDFILFGALISLTMLVLYSKYRLKRANTEEVEKEKKQLNIYKFIFNVVGVTFIYLLYVIFWSNYFFNKVFLYIPAIIFIIAVIVKLAKHKKIGNIICVVNCICMIIIGAIFTIPVKKVINHNNKIDKYIYEKRGSMIYSDDSNVLNIKKLIQAIIEINKSDRKVSVQYKDKTYISEKELKELLESINTNIGYYAQESYDKDGTYKNGMYEKYNKNFYINNIKLRVAVSFEVRQLIKHYVGDNKRGSNVKQMIESIIANNDATVGESGKFISIKVSGEIPNLKNSFNQADLSGSSLSSMCDAANVYSEKKGDNTQTNIDNAKKEMRQLYKAISSGKTYKIEFIEDSATVLISDNYWRKDEQENSSNL